MVMGAEQQADTVLECCWTFAPEACSGLVQDLSLYLYRIQKLSQSAGRPVGAAILGRPTWPKLFSNISGASQKGDGDGAF